MPSDSLLRRPADRPRCRDGHAGFLLTQLIGLLRSVLIYRAFGTSAELDSFNAANRVTELLFNLMAGGALGSAFIPTFTGLLATKRHPAAWQLASAIANLLLLVLSLVAAAGGGFCPADRAPRPVRALAGRIARAGSPDRQPCCACMLPTVVIFGLSGLVMGILNAHQHFWLPAIAPAMYSLGQIGGGAAAARSRGASTAWRVGRAARRAAAPAASSCPTCCA